MCPANVENPPYRARKSYKVSLWQ